MKMAKSSFEIYQEQVTVYQEQKLTYLCNN